MTGVVLASSSPVRSSLLCRAGISFETVPARIDEAAIAATLAADGTSPRDVADALAEAKSMKVSSRYPSALVIGADQVLDLDGEILWKAGTPEELNEQLLRLRGRRHRLWSAAVASEEGTPVWRHIGEARLHVRSFSEAWLGEYVERNWDRVRGSVGGYLIEEEGVRLFDRIEGDMFTVMGLPLIPLLSWLALRRSIPG